MNKWQENEGRGGEHVKGIYRFLQRCTANCPSLGGESSISPTLPWQWPVLHHQPTTWWINSAAALYGLTHSTAFWAASEMFTSVWSLFNIWILAFSALLRQEETELNLNNCSLTCQEQFTSILAVKSQFELLPFWGKIINLMLLLFVWAHLVLVIVINTQP